jgi:hypothetical protein
MEQLKRLLRAVDDFQQRHRWLAFPMAVAKKYGEDQGGQRVVDSAVGQFPVIGADISRNVSQSRLRGSGLALAVGALFALWGGLGVAEAAQAAMNGIWNVPRRRYPSFLLVIGLLSWFYLASTVTLFAAEANVVLARRLWPRSLAPPPLGDPDERPWRAWPSRRSGSPTSGSRSASTATPTRPPSRSRRLRPGSRGPARGRPRRRPRRCRPGPAGPAAGSRPPGGWSPAGPAG